MMLMLAHLPVVMSALSIVELVYEVMQWLDLLSVLQLGRTHWLMRSIAGAYLNRHIKLALQSITADPCQPWVANNMNIAVPRGRGWNVREFLVSWGYSEKKESVGWQWWPSMWSYCRFSHGSSHPDVMLSESTTRLVLSIVLSAHSMMSMAAITPRWVWTFHLALTYERRVVAGYRIPDQAKVTKLHNRGFTFLLTTARWEHMCQFACSAITRHIRGGRGIQSVEWNTRKGELNALTDHPFRWRLGVTCLNCCCPFFANTAL